MLRNSIDTTRKEEGWFDCPIHSSILLDDIKKTTIKKEYVGQNVWYSLHNYYDLDVRVC